MDFQTLSQRRVSVRAYQDKPVEREKLLAVLEAGRLAPSACNKQHWKFVVVSDAAARKRLGETYKGEWFAQAPVLIAVCVEPSASWTRGDGKNYAWVDGSIAMDHLTLAACEQGLGTCWIGAFDDAKARAALKVPAGVEIVALTPLGYPAEAGRAKSRKTLAEITFADEYGKPFQA